MARPPVVAGTFYEGDKRRLIEQIEWCFTHELGPGRLPREPMSSGRDLIGLVEPHAGYMYSGPVAAHGYLELGEDGIPETVVIIGPNHTGLGAGVSVYPGGSWLTPLGEVEVDAELARLIVVESGVAEPDETAHRFEHSVEVQVPFLQYVLKDFDFKIVPITMMLQSPGIARDLAKGIVSAADRLRRKIIVIASTDLTHYEPQREAERKDRLAIDAVLRLDIDELYDRVVGYGISMCGPGPTMTLMEYVRIRGGGTPRLLKYATSGDISGDYSAVVGYAAIAFYKR